METVCHGKQWDVLLAEDERGEIAAAMPYLFGKRWGLRYVLPPQLTQYNGPWYRPGCDVDAATRQLQESLDKLRLTFFQQSFAPTVCSLAGWKGYRAKKRCTYHIADISDPMQVFANFDKRKRQRPIRHAMEVLHVEDNLTPEVFASFHNDYFLSRGEKDLLSHDFIVRIISAALRRQQGLLLGLADNSGNLQAARFVAYDNHCAYALLSALCPGHHNGASPLLFWHILQRLAGVTRTFDFEGSMDPGIAYSYSLYGAVPRDYYEVSRCPNPLLRIYLNHKK